MMFLAALFLMVGTALAQTKVTGSVTSQDDGQPVIGATIIVVGTNVGTVTDANGRFELTLPEGKKNLRITYVGMEPLEVSARPNMRILLTSDQKALDEVVVMGYGSAKKLGSIVGAVKKVGNATLEKSTTPNFTDALAGQVAGLSVLSSSGDPTQAATIRLRGVNSINSSNTPLFILDGAPITSTLFNTLNPADIASITVLKDAASTAIYGSRAANGVIVITSKKGKLNEKANISLRAQYGISSPVEDGLDMMDAKQYVEFRDKIGQPVSTGIRELVDKYGLSTNWRDEILDKSAPTYTLEATVSGGSENTSYYISANHHKQAGIIEQSGMKRNTVRANLDTYAWLGCFSDNFIIYDSGYSENGRFQDSEKPEYKEKLKLIFVSHGSAENPAIPRTMVELMKSHGLNAVFYEPQGTAHEWLTWRRSLREFVPLIFK